MTRSSASCAGTVEEQDFTEALLMYLMGGVTAKDKAVRFRCTQMVALIMNELTEIGCVCPFCPAFQ